MRIALISEHASPLAAIGGVDSGGQNIYVANVARELAREGHKVDVFTRRDDPSLPPTVDMHPGVRVVQVPAGPASFVAKEQMLPYMEEFGERMLRMCASAAQREPYDIAHANFFMSGMAAQRLKRELGIPYVVTFHALGRVRRLHQKEADGFPEERFEIEEALVHDADRIVAECPQDRIDLIEHYGADPERLNVVPCGYHAGELAPAPRDSRALRARLGIADDEFVVLQLGRLVPRKGIDNVVRAVALLAQECSIRATLLVVGGNSDEPDPVATPEIARLSAIAEECGVADRVRFLGRRPREALRALYSAASVFVTTPWYEPFGITPVEAMACGTPVIGADVGGIRFTVIDGVTGYLVPPRDPMALARRLALLAGDEDLRRSLGRAGARRARHMFTWQRVARQLAAIYAQLVPAQSLELVAKANR